MELKYKLKLHNDYVNNVFYEKEDEILSFSDFIKKCNDFYRSENFYNFNKINLC